MRSSCNRLGRTGVLDRGVQDVAGFPAGAADEHVVHALGRVAGGRARTFRRFVVGVRVHLQEAESARNPTSAARYRSGPEPQRGASGKPSSRESPARVGNARAASVACRHHGVRRGAISARTRARIPRPRSGPARFDAPRRTSWRSSSGVSRRRGRRRARGLLPRGRGTDRLRGRRDARRRVDGVDIATKGEDDAYADLSATRRRSSRPNRSRAKIGDREVSADPSVLELDVDELATLHRGAARGPQRQPGRADARRDPASLPLRRRSPWRSPTARPASRASSTAGSANARRPASKADLRVRGHAGVEVEPRRRHRIASATRPSAGSSPSCAVTDREPVTLPVGEVEPQITTRGSRARSRAGARAARRHRSSSSPAPRR